MKGILQFYVFSLLFCAGGAMLPYGDCQTRCNVARHACYGSAGLVASHIAVGTKAALACNTVQGACMAECWYYGTAAIQSVVSSPQVAVYVKSVTDGSIIANAISYVATSTSVFLATYPVITGVIIGASTILMASYAYSLYTDYYHKSSRKYLF